MPIDVKAFLLKCLEANRDEYLTDLDAMTPEQLAASPGGVARTPYDFTFEIVFVNNRCAQRLRGETPEKSPYDGWVTAPAEFCDKPTAMRELEASANSLIDVLRNASEDDLSKTITVADGRTFQLYELCSHCISHMGYHDAQLNMIQAMAGDGEVHWK